MWSPVPSCIKIFSNDAETIPIGNVQQKYCQIKIHTDASEICRNNTQKITTLRISLLLLLFFWGGWGCVGSPLQPVDFLWLRSMDSRAPGLSSCGAQASLVAAHGLSSCGVRA